MVNEALQSGLQAAEAAPKPRRYRLQARSLGGVRPDVDIDKALRLAEALEDRELARKLEQRK